MNHAMRRLARARKHDARRVEDERLECRDDVVRNPPRADSTAKRAS